MHESGGRQPQATGSYAARHSPPCTAAHASSCQGWVCRGAAPIKSWTRRAAIKTLDVPGSKTSTPKRCAPANAAASARFGEFAETWGEQYPAIVALWTSAWSEFVPFLDYDVEIRRVICSTNAIESINARYRRAVRARGHFPNEAAALKCLYLVTRSLDPSGGGRARWVMRWKPALNAFAITFAGRFERTTH